MIELRRLIFKLGMRMMLHLFWFFPVKERKIVLLNGCNYMYSDSPKSIAEYLNKNFRSQIEIYFAVRDKDKYRENGIEFIRAHSLKYFYHVCTAKIFLTNDGGISYIPFRKKQFVINTWHGGGAYKPIGLSLNNNWFYKMDLKMTADNTNMFLSTCKKFTEMVSQALLIPKSKFWEIGLPRNDLMIQKNAQRNLQIRKKIGLSNETKMVLYAPTFRRDNASVGQNKELNLEINTTEVLKALNTKWPGKWVMGFRAHPGIKNKKKHDEIDVIDLSEYSEMQELLMAADALITDYSSSVWDFMLTKRPVFIFAPDLQEYSVKCKLYTPISEWPFPVASNMDEFSQNVMEFNYEHYLKNCEEHYKKLGGMESGRATELLGNYIAKIIESK